jgi:hypothetical protein
MTETGRLAAWERLFLGDASGEVRRLQLSGPVFWDEDLPRYEAALLAEAAAFWAACLRPDRVCSGRERLGE